MCARYFVNLNNNTFQLKRYYSLFIYIHSKEIISNVENVRLQPQYRPTDDASTRRWRGSQQANNDTFITSLATLSLSDK